MFGELPLEPRPTLCDDGSVAEDANPYALRFVADVETLLEITGDVELREDLQSQSGSINIVELFANEDLRERYLTLDPGLLRAQARTVAIPPPGWQPPTAAEETPPPPTATWRCELLSAEGGPCGREFATRRALIARQKFQTKTKVTDVVPLSTPLSSPISVCSAPVLSELVGLPRNML